MITPAYALTATERVLPSLALDFTTAVLDNRVTLTRALNTATRVNSSGYIETVNADTPRFDYNPVSIGTCKGLLVENQRTNLFINSGKLTSVSTVSGSRALDQLVAPDGTQTASIFSGDGNLFTNWAQLVVADGTSMTMSVYVKVGLTSTRSTFFFQMRNGATSTDFTQGTFNTSTGAITGTGWTSTAAGNDWYRISYTNSSGQTITVGNTLVIYLGAVGGAGYAITDQLGMWGCQVESGAFATSYIPAGATATLRNADVCSMPTSSFSYSSTAGAIVVSGTPYSVTSYSPLAILRNSATNLNDRIDLSGNSGVSTQAARLTVVSGGSTQYDSQAFVSAMTPNTTYKFAGTFSANSFISASQSTLSALGTSGSMPTGVDLLEIGNRQAGSACFNGQLQSLRYWPQRLLNAEMQALSK